jgi:drug/metabolite transporter (DMT)-like permease
MNVPLLQGNVLPSLLAALFWGGGDFSGGMGSKFAGGTLGSALRVLLVSHSASLVVLLSFAALHGDPFPHGAPLAWALLAGVTGALALACFYIALARGSMGASAAVSGLLAAAIPAAVSMLGEGFPGTGRLFGFLIAGLAIWMVAAAPTGVLEAPAPNTPNTMGLAIVAGAGFGIYFVALKMAGSAGLVWPMATARVGSLGVCSLLLLAISIRSRTSARAQTLAQGRLCRGAVLWALCGAVLDTSGNTLFLAATRAGRLDVAAVLASLYPASTILLAAWVLKERFSRRQALGMAIAAAAVVMITA